MKKNEVLSSSKATPHDVRSDPTPILNQRYLPSI